MNILSLNSVRRSCFESLLYVYVGCDRTIGHLFGGPDRRRVIMTRVKLTMSIVVNLVSFRQGQLGIVESLKFVYLLKR